jgi:hypothetical protein
MNLAPLPSEDDWNRHEPKQLAVSSDNPLLAAFAELWRSSPPKHPCDLLDCACKQEYETLLFETLLVLEASKASFQSNQVRLLRRRILEALQQLA